MINLLVIKNKVGHFAGLDLFCCPQMTACSRSCHDLTVDDPLSVLGPDRDSVHDGGEHVSVVPEVRPVSGVHSDRRREPEAQPQRPESLFRAGQSRAWIPAHAR